MKSQSKENFVFLIKLLAVIFGIAAVLGYFSFGNYKVFEREMLSSYKEIHERGSNLSSEQCVDEVIRLVAACKSMQNLCEEAVPRLMGGCLEGRDRSAECRAKSALVADSHFGYQECASRGEVGNHKHVCGSAYHAFSDFCKQKNRG